ncbi:MAG: hypothetical protein AMXMBFR83_19890 [Phycisphaerae bacterium]
MRRILFAFWLTFSAMAYVALSGCAEEETRIERSSTRIEKSEPRTVSPGQEVVE